MGLIPKYIDQVNTIVRWWENPCDAPWTLYLELAKPAAGQAVLSLLLFGVDDVIRGYARPKGIRFGRHMRGGRKGGRRIGIIPELGEMIGKRWPGYQELHAREVTDGVKKMWMIDGVIQRGLWYWLVADVTVTFFADWLSAVQESEVCRIQRIGSASWEANPVIGAIQGWQGFAVSPIQQHGPVHVLGSPALWVSGFGWTGGDCTVVCGIESESTNPAAPHRHLEMRITASDGTQEIIPSRPLPHNPNLHGSVMSPRRIKASGQAQIELRCVPDGFARATSCIAVAVQTLQDLA